MTLIRTREPARPPGLTATEINEYLSDEVVQYTRMLFHNGDPDAALRYVRGFMTGLRFSKMIRFSFTDLVERGSVGIFIEVEFILSDDEHVHTTSLQMR